MKILKKHFASFVIPFLCLCLICVPTAAKEGYSWFCPRTADHTQPQISAEMSFIEELGGYYVDRRYALQSDEKVIYLTFDAGYENGNIEKILDTLKAEQVSGAFFILSNLIIKNPELVLRMKNEGHTVGNHTSKHYDITKFADCAQLAEELEKPEALYFELTGEAMPKYFRPPEGRFSQRSMSYVNSLGYKTVFWSFAYADWDNNDQMSVDAAMKKITDNLHNGEIMLLHPTSATNAKLLPRLIATLKAQGYRFGTLDELTAEGGR